MKAMVLTPIVLIPARLGSTRLPGKVLADIGGRPMIAHVLARAQEAGLGPVAVACGEAQVAEQVEKAGGIAVLTDPDLPSGSDRIFAALQSLDPAGKHDVIVNLQGDLPSIDPSYLATVLAPLAQGYDIGTLVAPITTEEERTAPSVVKCACAFPDGADVAPPCISPAIRCRAAMARSGTISGFTPIAARRWSDLSPCRPHRWNSARSWSSCAPWRRACASARHGLRRRPSASIHQKILNGRGRR